MKNLLDKMATKWKNYKFRFVPWIMFNMNIKNSRNSLVLMITHLLYEVYRRLARHSPRAEANYAIQYNTVPCNTIYKVMKYTKYHL